MSLLDLFRTRPQHKPYDELYENLLETNQLLIERLNAIGAELDETRSMLADAEHENAELKKSRAEQNISDPGISGRQQGSGVAPQLSGMDAMKQALRTKYARPG